MAQSGLKAKASLESAKEAAEPPIDDGLAALSEETGRLVLAQLRRRSRALRIPPEDREDLVQDVAIWIASHREAGRPITNAWLWSALAKFARSVRRPKKREVALEELRAKGEPTRPPRRASASVAELTRNLGPTEKKVVERLLEGHTWESALAEHGIRHGSQTRWRSRIRRGIEKALRGGRSPSREPR